MNADATITRPNVEIDNFTESVLDSVFDILLYFSKELKSTNFLCFNPRTYPTDPNEVIHKTTGAAIHSIVKTIYLKTKPEGHLISYSYTKEDVKNGANIELSDCNHYGHCPMIIGHAIFLWCESKLDNYRPEQELCTGCGYYHDADTIREIRQRVWAYLDARDSPSDPNIGTITSTRTFFILSKIYQYLNCLTTEMYDLMGFVPKKLLCLRIPPLDEMTPGSRLPQICEYQYIFNDNIFLTRTGMSTETYTTSTGETGELFYATHTHIKEINTMPFRSLVENDILFHAIFNPRHSRTLTWSGYDAASKNAVNNNQGETKYVPPPSIENFSTFPALVFSGTEVDYQAAKQRGPKKVNNVSSNSNARSKSPERVAASKDLPDLSIFLK